MRFRRYMSKIWGISWSLKLIFMTYGSGPDPALAGNDSRLRYFLLRDLGAMEIIGHLLTQFYGFSGSRRMSFLDGFFDLHLIMLMCSVTKTLAASIRHNVVKLGDTYPFLFLGA
jgi:hypothetical protein